MFKPLVLQCATLFVPLLISAQSQSNTESDTTVTLNEITVHAFQYERKLLDVPAAIGQVNERDLERFNNTSFLPALNTIAGVRMEERSPGSYRLSIRGSTLRSPFGIRNIKVYFNGLPFTDPGGNTYLNLLDFSSIRQAEVVKGPGGSLYGAGTGGVLILNSDSFTEDQTSIGFSTVGGSYGLLRYSVDAHNVSENANFDVRYAHQQADGYREQSQMIRDAIQLTGNIKIDDKRQLGVTMFYTDLLYQTPGGLTKAQYDADPSQARPAGGPNPGAVEQHATVYNKTFYGGISHDHSWNDKWSNKTSVYGTFSQFENPTIRNFEKRAESSLGGRTNTQFRFGKGKLNFGGEFQQGYSTIGVYDNNGGVSGALQNNDEITSTTGIVFSQLEFFLPYDFFLTVGGSLNFYNVSYKRLSDVPPFQEKKNFDPQLSPRIALLKKLNKDISAYGSISKGFSPPTVAELYPSTATFNDQLSPEEGTSYELGIRGSLINNSLSFDLTAYNFQLDETIVVRRTDDGADYFVNAGSTSQKGLEVLLSWNSFKEKGVINSLVPWIRYTYNHYRFSEYVQGVTDYSGNDLTGVSPNIVVAGLDLNTKNGLYGNITFTYTDKIPLDDANTAFSDAYQLIGIRAGYHHAIGAFVFDLFAGVDNLLDEKYSLGNDLNAVAGRYYNAAARRNYYVGIRGNFLTGKR
ncbi:MAG TPA: TonB-dependent receptor [Cyclobacteriaceae bacterium]|nr:TonB-dependent receptor [Cyclobacteriaceae bacterium]